MRYSRNEEWIKIFFILLIVFILYNFILHPLGFLKVPALGLNDLFTNLKVSQKPLPKEIKDILVVTIDNDSLKKTGQKWPWERSLFAQMIDKISQGRPRAIFLDFSFLGKSSNESSDLSFLDALKNAGNVILAGYIDEDGEYVKPHDMFLAAAYGVGVVNKKPDSQDLKVRQMRTVVSTNNRDEPFDYGVEIKLLALSKGIYFKDIRYETNKIILSSTITIPIDKYGLMPINYSASSDDFMSIPAYKLLGSQAIDGSIFLDKIVMVGMTANISHDIHPTPLGKLAGVYINANSLLALMSANFINTLSSFYSVLIFLFLTFLIGSLSFRLKLINSTLILLATIIGISFVYLYLKMNYNFEMDIFSALFLMIISYLTVQVYKYVNLLIESEWLKNLAITDSLTGIYTQRYFQLNIQSAIAKQEKKEANFFCLIRLGDLSKLSTQHASNLPNIIKMLARLIKASFGKRALFARYGEDAISLCIWNINKKSLKRLLNSLIEQISDYDFSVGSQNLRLSAKISAIDFPREHIKNYSDLILTCESILNRIASGDANLAIFDANIDKVISSGSSEAEEKVVIPKDELSYVSLDLEARNKELETSLEELKKKERELEQLYFNTMHSLIKALEEKDQYTAGHSERVEVYSTALAQGLNLPTDEIETIRKAAYLHDIGKIGLPDRILHKKEKLDDNEQEIIKRHQADGAKILAGLPFFEKIAPLILHHHERYDGKGYPHGLSGDMIPRGAQIIAIADSFDAMTTGRGYNKPLLMNEAVVELERSSGIQFNPIYAKKFIELIEQKKIHAL